MTVRQQVVYQINQFFGIDEREKEELDKATDAAVERCLNCFSKINQKYYLGVKSEGDISALHSNQYTIFLYYLCREVAKIDSIELADKVYYLNKTLNCVDLYHQIDLPDIFCLEHPLGSVMGRARYGDGFMFQQGCTVGGNEDKDGVIIYPTIGDNVWLFANATVIGNTELGSNVFVAAQTYIKDETIPSNSIVFGQSPHLTIKQKEESYFTEKSLFSL